MFEFNMLKYLWILCFMINFVWCIPELKLLHVIFAHKSYAPALMLDISRTANSNFSQNLSYDSYHRAALDMPNSGKMNMYDLGVHLRDTYDEFLGSEFTHDIMKMRTSEYALSMLAGQLVNAGLWPPSEKQKWAENINWQPIPTDYVRSEEDTLLLGMNCPSFISQSESILEIKSVQDAISSYSTMFKLLSKYTGMKIERPSDVALLYATLETKADLNQSLPFWAYDIFPNGAMYNITLLEYDLLTHTPLQKKLNGGSMLKEIIGNCLKYIQGVIPKGRKIMLYSGDERNIIGLLKNFNLLSPHIPNEASAVITELHYDNETDVHSIKVKYYTGIDGDTIPLTVPNCTEMCPLKEFLTIFFPALPEHEVLLCNWEIPRLIEQEILGDFSIGSQSSQRSPQMISIFSLLAITLLSYGLNILKPS